MLETKVNSHIEHKNNRTIYVLVCFCFLFFLTNFLYAANKQLDKTISANARDLESLIAEIWDPAKYISIDEIQPGMQAYCLTCYKGTEIEKFNLEVLSVVHDVMPNKDWILVQGTDERFIYTGPVGGCSGSPVYIEGRLAGALAYAPGWPFSKDPLYGVTPIEEMLRTSQSNPQLVLEQGSEQEGLVFDLSKPIDFTEIDRRIITGKLFVKNNQSGLTTLPCPLITSGLSTEVCKQLDALMEPFGLMVVSGIGSGTTQKSNNSETKLAPGACLTVPLVTGDIKMEVLGTVTEIVGDKVYGLGHSLLGYGSVDLPIATGEIHTIVSNLARSFKLGSSLEIVGALTTDKSTGIYGLIGANAKMLPVTIQIDRYNDTSRLYHCQVANNRLLTPVLIRATVTGAALYLGTFPPDHMIEYKVNIGIEGDEKISFENVSTGSTLNEFIAESIGSIMLLMNNPYKEVDITSMDFDIKISPKSIISHIWSLELSDTSVEPGQEIYATVVIESFLAEKKKYQFKLKIPNELAPGKYNLIVCGSKEYENFLRKAVPHRFTAENFSSMIEAMNDLLCINRDKLYCLLLLPPGGITVERAELPDLPATKALILQNAKRVIKAQPYQHWLENSIKTSTVIIDKEVAHITVEK